VTARFRLAPGPAHVRRGGGWDAAVLSEREVAGAELIVVPFQIDGAPCALFRRRDGKEVAQALAVCVDPESVSIGTDPTPEPGTTP
jgi:hypothetical protein